jgi:hypothetical protein
VYDADQVRGFRWKNNKLEFLVFFVNHEGKYEDHEQYAPAALAFIDFDEGDAAENTVIKYINATEETQGIEAADALRKGLSSAILALPMKVTKAQLVEKYSSLLGLKKEPVVQPQSTQVHTGECQRDHNDPSNVANYEEVTHACYFKNGGKLHGVGCQKCKKIITESGPLKPRQDKAVYVCKSLMHGTSRSCLLHGAWCHSCYTQHQCSTAGRRRHQK